ncbi:MAG TPA: hypothetical protein DHW82_01295 [Spirochaetia bacterium]|nr:MAG: hypothetical protein A2Y41_13400 [Spirochaetes bacterium GWB1_36_13]HCL55632.1 hypothetical protein [Spirochaetia bacterium]
MKSFSKNIINRGVLSFAALLIFFIAAEWGFKNWAVSLDSLYGLLAALFVSLIPAFIWISFYYFLDREEREPIFMVFTAFLGGIFAYLVFRDFFGNLFFLIEKWGDKGIFLENLSFLFQEAVIPAFSFFFVMRFFFYFSDYFNEQADGLIYGAFIGIGYSFIAVLKTVLLQDEISLYYLIISLLIRLALFSSLGAVSGLFFGIARFKKEKKDETKYFIFSFLTSFLVFVLFSFLEKKIQLNITTSSDRFSLLLAFLFSFAGIIGIYFLIQREIRIQKGEAGSKKFYIDKISLIITVLFILSGSVIRIYAEKDVFVQNHEKKISFFIPSSYHIKNQEEMLFESSHSSVILKISFESSFFSIQDSGHSTQEKIEGYQIFRKSYHKEANELCQSIYKLGEKEEEKDRVFEVSAVKENLKINFVFETADKRFNPDKILKKILKTFHGGENE